MENATIKKKYIIEITCEVDSHFNMLKIKENLDRLLVMWRIYAEHRVDGETYNRIKIKTEIKH